MNNSDNMGALLRKYNHPVPRYTSFPTAVQFTQKISQEGYAQLLSELNPSKPVSVYIHIPFCHSMCLFCGCNTKIINTYDPVESYLRTLLAEISLAGEKLMHKVPVNLVHFGGGSPNYLKPKDLKRIIDHLSEVFDITRETNIDVESDPRYLDSDIISCFSDVGVSRVSLGVQDFNLEVQETINRIQPFDMVEKCVNELRDNGIDHINFDLMIGLPKQTIESVIDTAEQAASLSPHRLAVFPYAHVPWMKKHQKLLEKHPMADGHERFLMNEAVDSVLTSHGYKAVGTDHYARETDSLYMAQSEGRLRRNFQGYTTDISEAIIGFGQSSISSYKGAYVQSTTDPAAYRKAIANHEFPIHRSCEVSQVDQSIRSLIEELMCNFKVDIDQYKDALNGNLESIKQRLAGLEHDGLVTMQGSIVVITEAGKPFTRVVASCFDPYFNMQENQHAKAI